MNFLKVEVSAGAEGNVSVQLPGAKLDLAADGKSIAHGPMTLGLRPEHIDATGQGDVIIEGKIRMAEYLGSETLFFVTLTDGSEIAVKADGLASARPGDVMKLGIPAKACHLFDKDGNAVVNGDLTR